MKIQFKKTGTDTLWRVLQVSSEAFMQTFLFLFLAKILQPAEFGLFSLIVSIVAFFRVFGDFGNSRSSSKYLAEHIAKGQDGSPKSIILGAISLGGIYVSIVVIVYRLSFPFILTMAETDQFVSLLNYGLLLLIFSSLWLLIDGLFIGARIVRPLSIIHIISKCIQFSLLVILLCIYKLGVSAAVNAVTAGYFSFVVIGVWIFFRKFYRSLPEEVLIIKPATKRIFRYSIATGVMALAIYCYTKVDIIILGYFHDVKEVARYNFAAGIFYMPLLLLSAYSTVTGPVVTADHTMGNQRSLDKLFSTSITLSFYFMLISFLGIWLFSDIFVNTLFPKYSESVILLKILSLSLIIKGLGQVSGIAFLVPTGNAKINMKILIFGAFANTFLDILLIPKYGALGSVITTAVVHTACAAVSIYLTVKKLRIAINVREILFPPSLNNAFAALRRI